MLRRWSFLVLVAVSFFGSRAWSQETTPATVPLPPTNPIAVMTFASIERFLLDIDWTFETAGRPELTDFVAAQLGNVNDLKGIDRDKPFGVLLFLKAGLPPIPTPVAFVPVSDIDELMTTVGIGPVKLTPIEGKTNRYELKGRRRDATLMLQDGFALITNDDEFFEEQEIANPAPFVAPLAARYDFSINLRIREVPATLRDVAVGALRTTFAAEMQQRDGERESVYKMRKANGTSTLEFLTNIIDQGDQFTLGWDASQENKSAVLEWQIEAVPGSGFAKYLKEVAGKPTTFHAMLNDSHPFTIAASWAMDKREKKAATEGLQGLMVEINNGLLEKNEKDLKADEPPAPLHPGLQKIQDVVLASVEDGHVDGCIQMVPMESGKFALIGGLRVAGAETLGTGIREVLQEVLTKPDVEGLELDTDSHLNISFHTLTPPGTGDFEERVYGGKPSFKLGAGGRNLWFCFGTPDAFTALKNSIDLVMASGPPTATTPSAPFQVQFRMAPWLQVAPEEGDEDEDLQVARDAFSSQDDAARIIVRPTETGLRTRLQLDEGFVRWLGMGVAKRIDGIDAIEVPPQDAKPAPVQ